MLKYTTQSRQIRRDQPPEYFVRLAKEMRELGHTGLRVDMQRLMQKDLSFLEHFEHLTSLSIENGCTATQIKKISLVPQIKELHLLSAKAKDYDFLNELKSLETLDIRGGSTKDYSAITGLSGLKAINFLAFRCLKDLSFLQNLTNLQFIGLERCSNVKEIPDLVQLTQLRQVELDTMKRLEDFCGISKAPNTENLLLFNTFPLIKVESFQCFEFHNKINLLIFINDLPEEMKKKILTLLEGHVLTEYYATDLENFYVS